MRILPPGSSSWESDPLSICNNDTLRPCGLCQNRDRLLQQWDRQIRKFRGNRWLYDLVERHDGIELTSRGCLDKIPRERHNLAIGPEKLVVEAYPFVQHLGPFFRESPIQ